MEGEEKERKKEGDLVKKLAVVAVVLLVAVLSCSPAPEKKTTQATPPVHREKPPESAEPLFILPVSTPEPSDIPWTFDVMDFYSKRLPAICREIDSLVGKLSSEKLVDEKKAKELADKMKRLARKLALDISYNVRVKKAEGVEVVPLTPDVIKAEFAEKHGFVLAPEEVRLLNRILSSSWAGGKRIVFRALSPYKIVGAKLVLFPKAGKARVVLGKVAKDKTYEMVFDSEVPFGEVAGAVLILVKGGGGEIRIPYGFLSEEEAENRVMGYAEAYIGIKDLREILKSVGEK